MASYIDCVVDTHPMAQQISSVSSNVSDTTKAVVGMRAAVILAEQQAADRVCENVNKGFYTLIHSQISQKIAKLKSEAESHAMRLQQQKKQLQSIQSRMDRDYGMLTKRYHKLFQTLNKSLELRVFELDKPITDFSVKEVTRLNNRTKALPATVPVSQVESLTNSQKIIASNMKFIGMNVINTVNRFLVDMAKQEELTEKILLRNKQTAENASISVPVAICECNYDQFSSQNIDITTNDSKLTQQTQASIKNTVRTNYDKLEWEKKNGIDKEIQSEFSKQLAQSSHSQRVKDMANKLFLENNYETLKTR